MSSAYDSAIERLGRALKSGINPSLAGIRELASELGDPHDSLRCIQVAGTNGKTSTSRLIESLLRGHGLKTGLYTSPHLERYPERMEVAGAVVTDDDFAEAVGAALDAAERLRPGTLGTAGGFTEFEVLTAAALWRFSADRVEAAVLEVGMGGRWDSTTVVRPEVAVITGIGLDHTSVLGDTIEKIAAEKAGILKPRTKAVFGPGTGSVEPYLLAAAREVGVSPVLVRDEAAPAAGTAVFHVTSAPEGPTGRTVFELSSPASTYSGLAVPGPAYQAGNAATAIVAAELFLGRPLDPSSATGALASVRLPGRFEVLSEDPLLLVDGSHNPQAAEVLARAVEQAFTERPPSVLLGILSDKDVAGIVSALAPVASSLHVTTPGSPRALSAQRLAEVVEQLTGTRPVVHADVASALRDLLGRCPEGLLVTGSLVTAGEARSAYLRLTRE